MSPRPKEASQLKKQISLHCMLAIFVAYCPLTFGQQTAHSQNTPPKTGSSLTDTQQKNVQEYIELLRS